MKKPATKAELEYMAKIKHLPCVACGKAAPNSAHHIREGAGTSQRNGHFLTIPLCYECHQGDFSTHKSHREFHNVYGDELSMLNKTIGMMQDQKW